MITDEQVNLVATILNTPLHAVLVRKALEAYENSKPKHEPYGYFKVTHVGVIDCNKTDNGAFQLYTTPPTQEPLSEEEIEKLVPWQGDSKDPFFNRIEFARAVEQAHGIGIP